jgi:multicomponent Na+:H+ antiporter subunit B
VTRLVARLLLAPALVVAAALLVKGYAASGGGFAAGVVASLGVLLQHVSLGGEELERRLPWTARAHRLALAGLALAAAVALAPAAVGLPPVRHLPRPGSRWIELGPLELHSALLFDLGVALATFGFVVAALHRLARTEPEEGGR